MIHTEHVLNPQKKHRFFSSLLKSEFLSSDVKQLTFSIPQDFKYLSGSYINLSFVNDGKAIGRAYSIASFGQQSCIQLCVKLVPGGVGSNFLFSLQKGDSIKMTGPLGDFFIHQQYIQNNSDIFFICVGTGIAPFRAMIQDLLFTKKVSNFMYLISGFRKEDGILYQEEWKKLQSDFNNFSWINTLSRPEKSSYQGELGRIQILLEKIIIDPINKYKNSKFYICGLHPMIQDVEQFLISKGIFKESIHYESYD